VLSGTGGHAVRNNSIHHLPWSAILIATTNSVIELNDFHATQQEGSDNGTLYTYQNTNAGIEIRYNYFHDVPRPAAPWSSGSHLMAVYLDTNGGPSLTTGFNVHGNVFYRYGDGMLRLIAGSRGVGIENKGSGNVFRNNLFAKVDVPYLPGAGGSGIVEANQAWRTGIPLLFLGNGWRLDPGFVDEARGNLANRPDGTIVLDRATEPIPFSRIGIVR
jgi:hypothetical protein